MPRKLSSFQPVAFSLTVLAALVRLAPHPPNFAPIGSVALFGGARLRGWQAYLVPLLAMLVTDPILSRMVGRPAYSSLTPVIYGCFLINVLLGRLLIRNSTDPLRIASAAIIGSVQFFLFTNFFGWLGAGTPALYTHNLSGLLACYIAAIPFFGRTLAGDLFYSAVLFTAYELLKRRVASEQTAAA
jgi:hypothetical protein